MRTDVRERPVRLVAKRKVGRTTASVIPRQIPEPPPVQNSTLPLNISGLKIAVESTIGVT